MQVMFIVLVMWMHHCNVDTYDISKYKYVIYNVMHAGTWVKCMLDNQLMQKKKIEQHPHYPPKKMKDDASKFKSFHMHFSLHIEYTTMRKYLAYIKEKQLINFFKTNIKLGHNVLRGHRSCDPIYRKQQK